MVGQIQSRLESKDKNPIQPIFVIDNLARPLLGLPALTALHLVERKKEISTLGEKGGPGKTLSAKSP